MGKVKVKNISNSKMNAICKSHNCTDCPLKRLEKCKDGKQRYLLCYRRLRAWHYANKYYYEELFKQPLTEKQIEYHEWRKEEEEKEWLEMEEQEIDINV